MVFATGTEPDQQIIEWLLQCVTFKAGTRQFSLYNTSDALDPTPVLRSFLLKLLLLCTQSEIVCNHLNQMLVNWGADERQRIQTMELLMDCRKVGLLTIFHDLTCSKKDFYHVFFLYLSLPQL